MRCFIPAERLCCQATHRRRKKTVIWFIWFVLFVWLDEINRMNQINQINKTNQINQIDQLAPALTRNESVKRIEDKANPSIFS